MRQGQAVFTDKDEIFEVGDKVEISSGQHLGRQRSKVSILATIVKVYSWSWTGCESLDVRCSPRSRIFTVNLKDSIVRIQPSTLNLKGGIDGLA